MRATMSSQLLSHTDTLGFTSHENSSGAGIAPRHNASGVQEFRTTTTANVDAPTRNLQDIKDKHADQPAKNVPHPTTSTCCLCSTAVAGNIFFFSKMYVQDVLRNVAECIV